MTNVRRERSEVYMKTKRIALQDVWLVLILGILCVSACKSQGVLSRVSTSKAGVAYDVYVEDGYAYITNNDGVVIFDVSEPDNPQKVGKIISGTAFGVFVDNGLTYIAGEGGLVIADVSDPANPRQLGKCSSEGVTNQVRVYGSYAYIAGSTGLEIMDVGDPSTPKPVTRLSDSGGAMGVEIYDSTLYLAKPGEGLEVIDVTDPYSPQKITTVAETQGAWDIHMHEDILYLGCHGAGVRIINISDRESPQIIGRFNDDDEGEALGVWGDGKYLYVADNYGIEVLDIKDPTRPIEISEYDGLRGAHDLYVVGTLVYVAEARKGLIILEHKGEP
jgi:hypothetical protein